MVFCHEINASFYSIDTLLPLVKMDIPIHMVYLVKLHMLPQIEWELHQLKEDNFGGILFEQSKYYPN